MGETVGCSSNNQKFEDFLAEVEVQSTEGIDWVFCRWAKSTTMEGGVTCCKGRVALSKLWIARSLFILTLAAIATVLGWACNEYVARGEEEKAETGFDVIVERALTLAQEKIARAAQAAESVAIMIGNQHPDADAWPFVAVPGFVEVSNSIVSPCVSPSGAFAGAFVPFLSVDDAPAWEEFAYEYIEQYYPPGWGISSFGKGIWAIDLTLNNTDKRYHDTTGVDRTGVLSMTLLAPVFHANRNDIMMLNTVSIPEMPVVYETLYGDLNDRKTVFESSGEVIKARGVNTGFIDPDITFPLEHGPHTSMVVPIYPKSDPFYLAGATGLQFRWTTMITGIVNTDVSGLICIVESSKGRKFTWIIQDGEPVYVGEGVFLEGARMDHARSIELTTDNFFLQESVSYKLTIYPVEEFFENYYTTSPLIVTSGAVSLVVVAALMFLFYDTVVRKEFDHKKAAMDAKRQFMRFVSHEVRTPLNAVCMGLSVLEEEIDMVNKNGETPVKEGGSAVLVPKKKAELMSLCRQIGFSADSAADILNDLLNYDKIEHGEMSLEEGPVPIWPLVQSSMKEFELPALAKEIESNLSFQVRQRDGRGDNEHDAKHGSSYLSLPADARELVVIGDSVRLAQVFRNILSNAIKFTPEKGILSVECKWEQSEREDEAGSYREVLLEDGTVKYEQHGSIRVDVTDSGPGMNERQLLELFGRGVQFNVNSLQAGKGSGLGLYIAKGLVEQHRGTLTATSPGLDLGSTFSVVLPLYRDVTQNFSGTTIAGLADGTVDSRESDISLYVLVVDDVAINRKLIVRLLENRGHECDQAENGREAVRLFEEKEKEGMRYDSILIDYEMPVMNGPAATKALRSLGCTSRIIGITGNVLPDDVSHFKESGANRVLAKPLKFETLLNVWSDLGLLGK